MEESPNVKKTAEIKGFQRFSYIGKLSLQSVLPLLSIKAVGCRFHGILIITLRREILCLEVYHHPEVASSGQFEIEPQLCEMSKMADHTMMIKYIIRNTALKYGKTATFLPKPILDEAGNGMHVHMLLMKDGQPSLTPGHRKPMKRSGREGEKQNKLPPSAIGTLYRCTGGGRAICG